MGGQNHIDQAFGYEKATALSLLVTQIPLLKHALLEEKNDSAYKRNLELIIEAFETAP